MHAFLVNAAPDFLDGPDVLKIAGDAAIGIEQVRQIRGFLTRKPLQKSHNTVVVYEAQRLTVPAQNALLKTLEEPPTGALIYLVTNQAELLLATVKSRLQEVRQRPSNEAPQPDGRGIFSPLLRRERNPSEAESSSHSSPGLRPRFSAKGDKAETLTGSDFLTKLRTKNSRDRLKTVEDLGVDRIGALMLMDQLEKSIHADLSLYSSYEIVAQTRKYLKANVNVKLAMDWFAINL